MKLAMVGLIIVSLLLLCIVMQWVGAFNLPVRRIGLKSKTSVQSQYATHSRQTLLKNTNNLFDIDATSETPVLCHFSSPLSAPCTMFRPVLTEVHKRLQGAVELVELNVDETPILISKYQLQVLPTTVLFKKGRELGR